MTATNSHRFKLALAAVGAGVGLYLITYVALILMARWSEANLEYYPYRSEDNMRILLPGLFEDRGEQRIFLAGPSEAREGLLDLVFENASPGTTVYQAAQSLGTIDDLVLAFEYLEKVYDRSALPARIVLGISPRFVANIPEERPLKGVITRYSPFYRVVETAGEMQLVRKTALEGFLSRSRWLLFKQQERFHSSLIALFDHFILNKMFPERAADNYAYLTSRSPGSHPLAALNNWVKSILSHSNYHHRRPLSEQAMRGWISDPGSFWYKGYRWNPAADSLDIFHDIHKIREIAARWHSELYVINLPEHPMNRVNFNPRYYQSYLRLVKAALENTPFLNLREMLPADAFYDVGHPTIAGALKESQAVVEYIETHQPTARK